MKRKAKPEELVEIEEAPEAAEPSTSPVTVEQLLAELAVERDTSEQLRVQLAGCLTAAEGCLSEDVKEGSYGWSLAFEKTRELRRDYDLLRAQLPSEVLPVLVADDEEEVEFLRESVAGVVVAVSVAYREFVKYLNANFPPWGELPDETKQLYVQGVEHVRAGNGPRSEFERVVRRLLDESPLADRVTA